MESTDRRIVLLGKTGVGKSSIGNTIFDENIFQEFSSSVSGTKKCRSETKNINGRNIQLIDTPGFFDTDPNSKEYSPELLRCVTECAPGPHAFLIVLKVERYTEQEQATVQLILRYFTEEALKYATVVFTHGDQLPEEEMIEEWAGKNEALKTLLERCGNRCHVLDNKYWKNSLHPYRNNQKQISKLLNTIDETVAKNRGKCYTNEMLTKVHHDIQIEIRPESGITAHDILQRAKEVVYVKLIKNTEGAVVGVLLGALLGSKVMVDIVVKGDLSSIQSAGLVLAGMAGGGAAGGLGGAFLDTEMLQNANGLLRELHQLYELGCAFIHIWTPPP